MGKTFFVIFIFSILIILVSCNKSNLEKQKLSININNAITSDANESTKREYKKVSEKLDTLYKNGVTPNSQNKVYFLFYCPTVGKAERLQSDLVSRNYVAEYNVALEEIEGRTYFLAGNTYALPINLKDIYKWNIEMYHLADKYKCEYAFWDVESE